MERRQKQRGRWHFVEWKAVGVLAGKEHIKDAPQRLVIHEGKDYQRVLWTNFVIQLFKDQAESYWSNLMGEQPSLFVVCRREETDDEQKPFLVTVNYDEIVAYQEVDDDVHRLPLFPELYHWVERYVVNNYVPKEPKKKRKREDWSSSSNV